MTGDFFLLFDEFKLCYLILIFYNGDINSRWQVAHLYSNISIAAYEFC